MYKRRYMVQWFNLRTHKLHCVKDFPAQQFVTACLSAREDHPEFFATLYDFELRAYRNINPHDLLQDHIDVIGESKCQH